MKVGELLPHFNLPDQDWNNLSSDDLIGKPSVIYFYPKDDTPGCVRQACSFRDQYEVFKEIGAEVVGISSDTPEIHRNFQSKHNLPYRLLSDKDDLIRKKFKVPTNLFGLIPGRVTFIFDESGCLIHRFNSQMQAERHIEEALNALKAIH